MVSESSSGTMDPAHVFTLKELLSCESFSIQYYGITSKTIYKSESKQNWRSFEYQILSILDDTVNKLVKKREKLV